MLTDRFRGVGLRCLDCGKSWGEGEEYTPYCGGGGWLDFRIKEVTSRASGESPHVEAVPVRARTSFRGKETSAHWSFPNPYRVPYGDDLTVEFKNGTMTIEGGATVHWSDRVA